ncbi:hypothetical protein [Corynebacterium sp. HMSC056E09]|uniref:hypothetical protein n=1 Tax=Corynebacterium sp. HMSC056E09 TaxID=1739416 RepID=UPI0008A4126C|nr:hypothetical protein [Corynebacterium sp. HMSC056E09]
MQGYPLENSFAEYEHYFPLKGLGAHCEVAAHTVNEMARSPRVLTAEAADALEAEFEPKIRGAQKWGISRLPDELTAAALQAAGAALHSIGLLLKSDIRYPLTPSILARPALENAALVMYVNEQEDPWVRTARAVNVVINGYENSDAARPDSKLHDALEAHQKIRQAFASQGYGRRHRLLPYTDLVETYFDGFKGREMYNEFNRSVHHNVVRQIEIAISADIGSCGNAIETYEVAIRTAIAVGAAAFSLKDFRHCDDVDEAPLHLLADVFKSWSAYLDGLGDDGFVD